MESSRNMMCVCVQCMSFLQTHLLASHAAELAAVQDRYSSAAKQIGLGHRQAQQVEKVNIALNWTPLGTFPE